MAVIQKEFNYMAFPQSFSRGNPIPLDKSSLWFSMEEMSNYSKTDATAYVGQILTLVNEADNSATAYIISNAAGDLVEVGAATLGDDKTITLDENGVLSLKSWGKEYYRWVDAVGEEGQEGYVAAHHEKQLVDETHPWIAGLEPKSVAGTDGTFEIAWYQPSTTTVEDLSSAVNSLQTSVETIQQTIGGVDTVVDRANTAAENAQTVADTVQAKLDNGDFVGAKGERGQKGDQGAQGPQGPKGDTGATGPQGAPGSDASVTAENIQSALGYTPVKNVQMNGDSLVQDSVATIPLAGYNRLGAVQLDPAGFAAASVDGMLSLVPPTDAQISTHTHTQRPITPSCMDYAVKSAMCDGKGAAWTAAEQKAARERMGVDVVEAMAETIAKEPTAQQILAVMQQELTLLNQLVENGMGGSGSLNGFSFSRGENGELIISYVNPDDETDTATSTFATKTLADLIAQELASINVSLHTIAGMEQTAQTEG